MKALSLTQPWATLVSHGWKTIETRSWSTKYRGPLAIHAAKALPKVWTPFKDEAFVRHLRPLVGLNEFGAPRLDRLPRGMILATCDLDHIIPTWAGDNEGVLLFSDIWDDDPEDVERLTENGWWLDMGIPVAHWPQRPFGDFSPSRFAWMLAKVRGLSAPVPCRGWQGLWNVPDELLDRLAA